MTSLADQLKLEIDTSTVRNAVLNPDGHRGLTGWTSSFTGETISIDDSDLPIAVDGKCFAVGATGGEEGFFDINSDLMRAVPGQYFGAVASFHRPAGRAGQLEVEMRLNFLDANESGVGGTVESSETLTSGSIELVRAPALAPAGTVFVRVVVKATHSGLSAGDVPCYFGKVFAAIEDTELAATVATWTPPTYTDVLGDTFSIAFEQGNELDGVDEQITPGILTATTSGSTIDPAANEQVYRGAEVRLSTLVGSEWEPQYTGVAEVFRTSYDNQRTTVVLTATDAAAATSRSNQDISGTESLASVLGHDVGRHAEILTNDGSGDPLPNPSNRHAYREGSRSSDWLRRACNTFGGYAWVDKHNVMTARLKTDLPTATTTFSDDYDDDGATYYTGIDLAFSSEAIVNELTVTRINRDETDGSKVYGPYLAPKSIRKWGRVPADVEILDGVPADIADDLLAIFATPSIYPYSLTFSATNDVETATTLELYQKIRVKRSTLLDDSFRLIKFRHTITASTAGDKWLVTLFPRPLEDDTSVVVIPPAAGAGTGPADLIPAPAVTRAAQAGVIALNTPSGGSTDPVTFPIPYPTPPAGVSACVYEAGTGNTRDVQVGAAAITETGFSLKRYNIAGAKGTLQYVWTAVWQD